MRLFMRNKPIVIGVEKEKGYQHYIIFGQLLNVYLSRTHIKNLFFNEFIAIK